MIALGALIAVGAVIAGVSATVLLASEARTAPISDVGRLSLLARLIRRPRWSAGAALMATAWPLQVAALGFAPLVIVQPILATFFLFLLVVARVRLGEQVGAREWVAVLMIMAGIGAVLLFTPRHIGGHATISTLALPLAVVGGAAVAAFAIPRARGGAPALLAIGAGLGYAWADFANNLLSENVTSGRWAIAGAIITGVLTFGGLAFLPENSGLAVWPAVRVAPTIGAIQLPLPVLMALWGGVEVWRSSALQTGALLGALVLVVGGAVLLGRSHAVARAAGAEEHAAAQPAPSRVGSH